MSDNNFLPFSGLISTDALPNVYVGPTTGTVANVFSTASQTVTASVYGTTVSLYLSSNGVYYIDAASTPHHLYDASGNIGTDGGSNVTSKHLISAGGAPGVLIQSAAGTGATCSVDGASNDLCGLVTVNTGTGATSGVVVVFTFNVAFATAPRIFLCQQTNTALSLAASTISTTGFSLVFTATPASSATYKIGYMCVQ